jgi:hypothetical protein
MAATSNNYYRYPFPVIPYLSRSTTPLRSERVVLPAHGAARRMYAKPRVVGSDDVFIACCEGGKF